MPLFDVARVFLPNCRSLSKQDDSTSLGMRWGWIPHSTLTKPSEYQLVDCWEIGSVPLVAHDTPGFVLWKQTCCLSTLAWKLHGDLLRIEHAGGTSWRLLRSSRGHAPDDDDDDNDDDDDSLNSVKGRRKHVDFTWVKVERDAEMKKILSCCCYKNSSEIDCFLASPHNLLALGGDHPHAVSAYALVCMC